MPVTIRKDGIIRLAFSREGLDRTLLRYLSFTLLFLYLYAPTFRFLPVNLSYLIILCALLYFSLGNNLDKLKKLYQSRILLTFIYFYAFSILYILLVPIFTDNSGFTTYLLAYIRLLFDLALVLPFFIMVYKDELNLSLEQLLHDLVIIATIQGVIAAIMLAVPGMKTFVFSYIINLPSDKLLATPYRGFGLSYDYFYSMPLFQSLALVLTTKFLFERGKRYLLCYPFILLSMMVNARISLLMIPVFAGVFFIVTLQSNDVKWLRRLGTVGALFLILIVLAAVYFILNPKDLQIILWSFGGIYDAVMAVFGHGQSVTINRMILENIHIPHQLNEILFGEGLNVFGDPKSPVRSDLGFFRYIYFGGILFSLIIYLGLLNFHLSILKLTRNIPLRMFLISAGIMFLLAHFKGDAISSSAFTKGIFIVQLFILYDYQKRSPAAA